MERVIDGLADAVGLGLQDALRIAMAGNGPPLVLSADAFANACVLAAVMHPEWAVAITRHCDAATHALAESLVRSAPVSGDWSLDG